MVHLNNDDYDYDDYFIRPLAPFKREPNQTNQYIKAEYESLNWLIEADLMKKLSSNALLAELIFHQ